MSQISITIFSLIGKYSLNQTKVQPIQTNKFPSYLFFLRPYSDVEKLIIMLSLWYFSFKPQSLLPHQIPSFKLGHWKNQKRAAREYMQRVPHRHMHWLVMMSAILRFILYRSILDQLVASRWNTKDIAQLHRLFHTVVIL